MGLAERKVKQRIGADPRNLTWAENAAKFGHTYLAKHGWNPTMGLGVAGDGRVSHIAVAQKLDQLGIGAGRPDGPDAIAWKQAKEFEGLLERLNAAGTSGEAGKDREVVEETVEAVEENAEVVKEGGTMREDKAKREERKREEKKKAKAALEASGSSTPSTPTETTPVAAPAPGRLAHRARFLAAKRLAGTSSTALSEILGVSSTPASTSSPSTPSSSTPAPTPGTLTSIPVLDDDNRITTSSQSVADYFRDKMRARAAQGAGTSASSTPVVVFEEPEVDVSRGGLGSSRRDQVEEEKDARPNGLGFCGISTGTGLGFKRASLPLTSPTPPEQTQDNSNDQDPKKERKRKRKEQAVAESAPSTAASTETESDRKAAKRARKEARRAARQQKEVEADTGAGDRLEEEA